MAKIVDFGLAKLRGQLKITKTGTTVGTATYMSPEQARGEELDQRTDIWSFGIILYEMHTGQVPFRGDYEQAVIFAIFNEKPRPVGQLIPGIPKALDRLMGELLSKDQNERPQHMKDIVARLRSTVKQSERKGRKTESAEPVTRKRKKKYLYAGIVSVLVLLVTAILIFLPSKQSRVQVKSIAVLPFENMSADPENEYFSDGLADELINALSKIKDMRVASRTSAFSFKGKHQDIREVGEQLDVENVLEGSVRKADGRVRVTAQLINVSDGYHLWSEKFDRELKDIFTIQEEISDNIVKSLCVVLSENESRALEKVPTSNFEAYDYYLRGRKLFYEAGRQSLNLALQMFTRATQLDPGFALAFTGLAQAHSWPYLYYDSTEENLQAAENASRTALQLDPGLAEAHVAYGYAVSLSKRFDLAEGEFETALELNPRSFEAYYFYARASFAQGKMEKTAQLYEMAHTMRPEDYQPLLLVVNVYKSMGLEQKTIDASHRGLKVVEEHLQLNPDDVRALYLCAGAYIRLGDQERGLEMARRVLAMEPADVHTLYNLACIFSLAGKIDEALGSLEKAVQTGYAQKEWIVNDSDLDLLRGHPRYQALLADMD